IKHDITESMLEMATGVCRDIDQAAAQLSAMQHVILQAASEHHPDILAACEQAMRGVDPDLDFIRVDEEAFLACPEESIDYAVME
ncbi:glutamate-cysteine ligase family protein, partial [Salmonella enterica subsp. enterica serovar Kentucky]|nr:glutamate-cysteine ligase family protein [Salmonella enterica subsp. enterica serovar Kentucky]